MKYFCMLSIIVMLSIHGIYSASFSTIRRQLKQVTLRFLKSLEQENCARMILNATVRDQYLAKTLIGRVQPVGTFKSTEAALEYLYGVSCQIPNVPVRVEVIDAVTLLHITYDADRYLISFKIRIDFVSKKRFNLYGMLAFDRRFKLCGYESVVQNIGLTFYIPPNQESATIQYLCQGTQAVCPVSSPLEQYSSFEECVTFLSPPNTPFGDYDRADQNNVICRVVHLLLAQISPAIHCPHLGKTGGGACTNKTADTYFEGTTDFVQCAHRFR